MGPLGDLTWNDFQGSVLGPLLFLLYINELKQAKKNSKAHHFVYDTNLLCLNNSIKKLNKLVNADLKHLFNWLNANKISVNVKKTEMEIFIFIVRYFFQIFIFHQMIALQKL